MDVKLKQFLQQYGKDRYNSLENIDENSLKLCNVIECTFIKNVEIPDLSCLSNLDILNITSCNLENFPILPNSVKTIYGEGNRFKYLPKLPTNLKILCIDDTIEYIMDEPQFFYNLKYVPSFIIENSKLLYAKSIYQLLQDLSILSYKKVVEDNRKNDKLYYDKLKDIKKVMDFIIQNRLENEFSDLNIDKFSGIR